jgi:hypothetical protein
MYSVCAPLLLLHRVMWCELARLYNYTRDMLFSAVLASANDAVVRSQELSAFIADMSSAFIAVTFTPDDVRDISSPGEERWVLR